MTAELHKKPLIPFGWLRVFVFLILYLSLIVSAGIVIALVLTPTAGAQASSFTLTYLPIIINVIITVALIWVFRKWVDRRSFESLGFSLKSAGMHAGAGFFMGVLLVCTGACILFFSKNLQWTGVHFNGNDLFISFGLMAIVAFYEELLLRGYILNNLMESVSKWPALIISALVFTLLHATNPDFSLVGALNILLAGLLLGLNYIYTKNLWFSILLHFSWNFFQGPVLGFEVSGVHLESLLQHEIQGSELITGGKFGFEGSLIATILLTVAAAAMAWVYQKKYAPLPAAGNTPLPA